MIRILVITLTIFLILPSCKKDAALASTSPKSSSKIIENYRTIDGSDYVLLMSGNECEITHDGTIFLGTYTKEQNSLRIVIPVLGASTVIYFNYDTDGIRKKDGKLLMNADMACISHARRIAIACYEYAQANGDNHPPSLDLLVPKYFPSKDYFNSPLSPNSHTIAYHYFPGNLAGSPYRVLLLSKYENSLGEQLVTNYMADIDFKDKKEIESIFEKTR